MTPGSALHQLPVDQMTIGQESPSQSVNPERATRIKELLNNGRSAELTDQDKNFILELFDKRLTCWPKDYKNPRYGDDIRNGSIDYSRLTILDLDFPLTLLMSDSPDWCQQDYLRWLANNGFGLSFTGATLTAEHIPEELLIPLLENTHPQYVHGTYCSWLYGKKHPKIVKSMFRIWPETRRYLSCHELARVNWLPGQMMELAEELLPGVNRPLGCSRDFHQITRIVALCELMLARHEDFASLIDGFSPQEKQLLAQTACLTGCPNMVEFLSHRGIVPELNSFQEGLIPFFDFLAGNTKSFNPVLQKKCIDPHVCHGNNWLLKTWSKALVTSDHFFSRNGRNKSYLASRCSLAFISILAPSSPAISLNELGMANYQNPSRLETAIMTALFLQRKLSFTETDIQESFFLKTVLPLQNGFDISTQQGFIGFMDRLIAWRPLTAKEHQKRRAAVPDDIALLRAEFCELVKNPEGIPAKGCRYDLSNPCHDNEKILFLEALGETEFMKYRLVSSFLEQGSSEQVRALLQHWLVDKASAESTKWLFHQYLHPNNTVFEEHINCNTLLAGALNIMPEAPSTDFPESGISVPPENEASLPSDAQFKPKRRIKRVLVSEPDGRSNKYLKIQDASESSKEFRTQYSRIQYLSHRAGDLRLKSTCVKPLGLYKCQLTDLALTQESQTALEKITGFERYRLVMAFSTPQGRHYDIYANDLQLSTEQAAKRLQDFAHDWGQLWRLGINGPDLLSAYHDKASGRNYQFLAELAHVINLGVIDEWRKAALYPNAGDTGMRDHGDAYPCGDFDPDHVAKIFSGNDYMKVNAADPIDVNRIRLLELAKTAWGLVIIWGDRYNRALAKVTTDQEKLKAKQDNDFSPYILPMLTSLFSEAFGRDKASCEAWIMEHDLYGQAIREMRYWMNNVEAPYIHDMKQAVVNRDVYPDFPDSMRATCYEKEHLKKLTEHGFINSEKVQQTGNKEELLMSTYLGARPFGRNPLLAFNQLVVKLITLGCLQQRGGIPVSSGEKSGGEYR